MVRDHRNEILRTCSQRGRGAVLAVAGWPRELVEAILALVGFGAGVLVSFIIEGLLDREGEAAALRERVRELERAAEQRGAEGEQLKYQLAVARQEAAINANACPRVGRDAQ